jgi:hypothetical protein
MYIKRYMYRYCVSKKVVFEKVSKNHKKAIGKNRAKTTAAKETHMEKLNSRL